jgi:hypothetical protein
MKPKLYRFRATCLLLAALGMLMSRAVTAQYENPIPEREGTVNEKRLSDQYYVHFDLQGSIDWAKLKQVGRSKVEYIPQIRENIVTFIEVDPDNPFINPRYISPENSVMHPGVGGGLYEPGVAGSETGDRYGSAQVHAKMPGYWGFRAGLGYVGKGGKSGDIHVNLNYLEIPIQAMYHYVVGPGNAYVGLGPYVAYGIGGGSGDDGLYGANADGYKRFDFGLSGTFGYRLPVGVFLALGYDFGLGNMTYANQDVTTHTRSFSINAGYDMGRLFKRHK